MTQQQPTVETLCRFGSVFDYILVFEVMAVNCIFYKERELANFTVFKKNCTFLYSRYSTVLYCMVYSNFYFFFKGNINSSNLNICPPPILYWFEWFLTKNLRYNLILSIVFYQICPIPCRVDFFENMFCMKHVCFLHEKSFLKSF